ncbi:MAG: heterodisulfide reductase-related iron-sulfur binding cluster [Ardenticatenaceae bacterium]|nr:heterodisulfide reductase-related iron-sulfur binding cluster [Ardenticatenaceae bacterium]
MQHDIKPEDHGSRGQAMADAVQSCVHCGFCLAACPTYSVLGEEMDSPRGRIYLMKNVLEGHLEAEEAQPYIDRCLGCMGCVPACPSGVAYGDLLTSYRAIQEKNRQRPLIDTITRRLIIETLPYPQRFRLAARTGKLGRMVQGALPDQLGAMIGLLPETLPAQRPLPNLIPAQGKRRARVAFLTGCVQQVLNPEINRATVDLLAANGVEVIIPAGQGCCGSILMHIGEEKRAQQLARNNLSVFPKDVDAIITNAAGCGSGMHEYPLLFKGESEESEAASFAHKVQDVTTFLAALGLRDIPEEQPPRRAAYHDACHLAHAQGITDPPRDLLRAIPNLSLIELNDGAFCCGSAGTYNLEQPEIAQELGRQKAQAIISSGAEMVVMGNIGCFTQIQTHLNILNHPLPIRHTVQLLADAYHL